MVTKCPLCNSNSIKRFFEFDDNTSIHICKTCSNAFTYPAPIPPAYENMDFHAREVIDENVGLRKFEELHEEQKKNYFIHLDFLRKYIKHGAKILEIGSGEGIFADLLIKEGYSYQGVEPSNTAVKRAKSKGLKIHHGYFPHKDISEKFDLIVLSHVLEHIEDPISILKHIKNIANKSAKVFLLQTNYKGFMPQLYKKHWYAWVPDQHLWHFTPKGLTYITKDLDYQVVDYGFTSLNHYHWDRRLNNLIRTIPLIRDQFHILFKVN